MTILLWHGIMQIKYSKELAGLAGSFLLGSRGRDASGLLITDRKSENARRL